MFAILCSMVACQTSAWAQAVERNLPPVPEKEDAGVQASQAVQPADSAMDDTPLAGPLQYVVFVDSGDDNAAPQAPVDTARVQRLESDRFRARMQPFLGQTISRRLLSEIVRETTEFYREQGFPFVSLSFPEQDITDGVVRIRVLEFHAGQLEVSGVGEKKRNFLKERLSFNPGEPIDVKQLIRDLEWLNRYPFRILQAKVAPGAEQGESDLQIEVTPLKRWRAFSGYSSSGAPSTGRDRYFAGAMVGDVLRPDSFFSYQLTGSNDVFVDFGKARYRSHAARLIVPAQPQSQLEFTFSAVESNQDITYFSVGQSTQELFGGYRWESPFSFLPGEFVAGAQARRQTRRLLFGDVEVDAARVEVVEFEAGWAHTWSDKLGRSRMDVAVHANPGKVSDRSGSTALRRYSYDRVGNAEYVYFTAGFSRSLILPHSLMVVTEVLTQYAAEALPSSGQIALGGDSLVRGYSVDDGSFDRGVVWRNELRLPGFVVASRLNSRWQDGLTPSLFLDAGRGEDAKTKEGRTLVSAGAALEYKFGQTAQAKLTVAKALRSGAQQHRGDWRVEGGLTLTY